MGHDSFSEQLRRAIDESGLSRYAICKHIGIHQSTMSKFMHGKGGMSLTALDRLAELLGLRIVAERKDG
jgi:transcriptional regulator with XRE-family HTH domain